MSRGRHVNFYRLCPCGCRDIIPISECDHRGVVVAVDVPRPTATPARVVRHGLSVDGDQGAPDHPGPHNRPGVVLSVNPSTQAAGAPHLEETV